MPELQYIKYDAHRFTQEASVVYCKIGDKTFDKQFHKNLYLCDCSFLSVPDAIIESVFEKCSFFRSIFSNCVFKKGTLFIDCDLKETCFKYCTFENEELYMFLKLSGCIVYNCLTTEGVELDGPV